MISPEVVRVSNYLVDLADNPIIDAASPTTISIFGGLVVMTMKDIQLNYLIKMELKKHNYSLEGQNKKVVDMLLSRDLLLA